MKKILLVMSLSIVLTGCDGLDKTDLFGYESYSHCMLETMSKQPSFGSKNPTLHYAISYCREKFPENEPGKKVEDMTDEELFEEADEIIKKYTVESDLKEAIKKAGLGNASNEDIMKLGVILRNNEVDVRENLSVLKNELSEISREIEKRTAEGSWYGKGEWVDFRELTPKEQKELEELEREFNQQ